MCGVASVVNDDDRRFGAAGGGLEARERNVGDGFVFGGMLIHPQQSVCVDNSHAPLCCGECRRGQIEFPPVFDDIEICRLGDGTKRNDSLALQHFFELRRARMHIWGRCAASLVVDEVADDLTIATGHF